MHFLKDLQTIAKDFTLLYVEDNKALRDKAQILLRKFFESVDIAEDGLQGLEIFKSKHYPIVITDIKMPHMDGLTLTKYIKEINPETKVIVMSAFDDKELLFKGIELGIFRFLTKPVNVNELAEVLYKVISEIKHEQDIKMFYAHLKHLFNYQSIMVVMLYNREIVLANDVFMNFFELECMDGCKKSFTAIGEHFLAHDGFLYNHEDVNVLDTLLSIPQKLFHVKVKAKDEALKHFILKYQTIPEKKGYGILSFDDVTELNLMGLFDEKESCQDKELTNTKALFDLLGVLKRNNTKVDIHNYYKGLSITNSGSISEIKEQSILLKTSYIQLKGMQLEQKVYIESSALPNVIEACEIVKISFEKQEVELKLLSFVATSPIQRKTIRVVPREKQSIALYLSGKKFQGEIEIEDISLNGIRVELSLLPAGLNSDSEIYLEIGLELDKKPLTIKTKAKFFKKSESKHHFSMVLLFEDLQQSDLVKYITKRQRELIREIKGMQNG